MYGDYYYPATTRPVYIRNRFILIFYVCFLNPKYDVFYGNRVQKALFFKFLIETYLYYTTCLFLFILAKNDSEMYCNVGQIAQSVERGIVVLMMKIVGGSNPTVSSLVGPVSELKSCLRGEVPGGCLRLLRSDRPNTAAHA
jgi:hypothetical protein